MLCYCVKAELPELGVEKGELLSGGFQGLFLDRKEETIRIFQDLGWGNNFTGMGHGPYGPCNL